MSLMLGADGWVDSGPVASSGCCPPLCGAELCAVICSFINLLPNGPMWDYHKTQALSYYSGAGQVPCEPACPPPFPCPSMIQHAIYVAVKLQALIQNTLWQVASQSNPETATEATLDTMLETLQWEDCYKQHCRSVLLGELTPYEINSGCGPLFCPIDVPPALRYSIKKGIVTALTRAQMGVIKNLAGLNWIIEPLGAVLTPLQRLIPDLECDDATLDPGCVHACPQTHFDICNSGDTIPGSGGVLCSTTTPVPVQAFIDRGCNIPLGLPQVIWPGVLAAECIVRSLLPKTCPNIIHRCC